MRYFLFTFFSLLFSTNILFSGAESKVTADPVYDDGGNSWVRINVGVSTTNLVLISSKPANSGLDITVWRFREIVNMSNGGLALYPNSSDFTAYSSTFGVHLSSDPAGLGAGDSWVVTHQGEVWGRWGPGTSPSGAGAGGYQTYWK